MAAPPQIGNIAPLGVRRGVATEVTISGSNLAGNPRLIAPFRFQIEPLPAPAKSDAANWKIKLTVAADVAVGVYPIRIQTDDGISNPFLLAVGQLPQVDEKEENSTFETAQAIPDPPLVVEGQVAANDVDFFRFHGKKGQFIVVDAQCARIGSGIDPTIRLTSGAANRAYIASADDSPGLLTDARLTAVLPDGRRLRGRAVRFALPGSEPAGLPPGHRGRADGRGDLPVGRPRRRDGRPGTTGWNARRGQDRRGHLEPAVRDRPGRAANLERDAGPAYSVPPARRPSMWNRWPRWWSRPIPRSARPPIRRLRRPGRSLPSCSTAESTRLATTISSSWR